MSISRDAVPRRGATSALLLLLAWTADAPACSCAWGGPFFSVVDQAPLVVRARVLRHQPSPAPALDLLVLETWKGGLLDSGLRVAMGDGLHCRPPVEAFPSGSEWVFALNGPGSKPGDGWALSHCGEFALRVEGDGVVGSLSGTLGEQRRMPLPEARQRLRYKPFRSEFRHHLRAGERQIHPLPGGLSFVLEPMPQGWLVMMREAGRDEDLARLTPPLHFVPNPREIEGWQFADPIPPGCSPPYGAQGGPPDPRRFIFSPEVGRTIQGADASTAISAAEVARVGRFGQGRLWVEEVSLAEGGEGCPAIATLRLRVEIRVGGEAAP
jgi:hypothetical protein